MVGCRQWLHLPPGLHPAPVLVLYQHCWQTSFLPESSQGKMAKLSLGPASHAVKSSRGPSSAPLHFYSTSYSRYHGNCDSGVEEPGTPTPPGLHPHLTPHTSHLPPPTSQRVWPGGLGEQAMQPTSDLLSTIPPVWTEWTTRT